MLRSTFVRNMKILIKRQQLNNNHETCDKMNERDRMQRNIRTYR